MDVALDSPLAAPISGPDGLLEALERTFGEPDYVPPVLPRVALRLQQLMESGAATVGDVVELVESDPLIAADVLRMAKSPFYKRRIPPASIQDAVLLLGFTEVRNVVWQVALTSRVFQADGFRETMSSLRRHSVATAHLARLVAQHTRFGLEEAFLAGLLHDAGLAACLVVLSENKAQIPAGTTPVDLEAVLFDFHENAGAILGSMWGLATPLCRVLSQHHGRAGSAPDPFVATVVVGQHLANELGARLVHEDGTPWVADADDVVLEAARRIQLDSAALRGLWAEADALIREIDLG